MNISQLQQVIGTHHAPAQSHHTEQNKPATTSTIEMPQKPEQLQNNHNDQTDTIDPNDPFLQMNTVSYLNNLLKFHKIHLQAELSNSNGQTYISLSDQSTGDLIKRLKIEDVITGLRHGDSSMINLSI
ncbi:hypothetical protein [Vibrio salinus]|uniref:hypothetical protein n=1 Tax=Vibrio salinus TaxID=2899784 RepID=UPI001E4F9F1B|nr:hypothetical protein [Vibrio salinus]MCE0494827.1 hypothetical protein [Vibrio salinus]